MSVARFHCFKRFSQVEEGETGTPQVSEAASKFYTIELGHITKLKPRGIVVSDCCLVIFSWWESQQKILQQMSTYPSM